MNEAERVDVDVFCFVLFYCSYILKCPSFFFPLSLSLSLSPFLITYETSLLQTTPHVAYKGGKAVLPINFCDEILGKQQHMFDF